MIQRERATPGRPTKPDPAATARPGRVGRRTMSRRRGPGCGPDTRASATARDGGARLAVYERKPDRYAVSV